MPVAEIKNVSWAPVVAETLEGVSVLWLVKVRREGWKTVRVFLEVENIHDYVCKLWEDFGIENVKVERVDVEQPRLPGF